ncbi:TetR/AcrR family transcriptional regulator, partial [Methylobacterium trifolii]
MARVARKKQAGPRGEHDREAFVALVTEAAEGIVRAQGPRALGMRRLAAAIGYAPNSIYNGVGDLDQVVLRVNARTFRRLHAALGGSLEPGADARVNALVLAKSYLAFVGADPLVWSLVHEYALAPGTTVPDWHGEALAQAVGLVDTVLAPLVPQAEERARTVAALWAAL